MVSLKRGLAKETGALLRKKGLSLALAESCTAGLLGYMITTVPGSSDYFSGGVIAYNDSAKMKLLDVSQRTLKAYGAVSMECAVEMATGIRKKIGSHIGISITGTAGPDKGGPSKPLGTVYIALSDPEKTVVKRFLFQGTRDLIRKSSAIEALKMLKTYLLDLG
ncbi:MAG: CinA family protein [Deltaproteobacteria bacterium]|nr:CinA family protein [Deltaproteobacteria bacterium]